MVRAVASNTPTLYQGNLYDTRYPALADVDLDGTIDRTPNAGLPDGAMGLVQNLANLMDTNDQRNGDTSPTAGTWVPANMTPLPSNGDGFGQVGGYGLEPGIREYIDARNGLPPMPGQPGNWTYPLEVPLEVRSIAIPNFDHFRTELLSCNSIILTVANPADGGWVEGPQPVPADQTGWHAVTAAGVFGGIAGGAPPLVAISDPWTDQAEMGFPDRVLPAGHMGPHAANVHNDPNLVSHDGYQANIIPHPTMGWAGASAFQLANYMNPVEQNNDATVVWMTIVYPTADMPVSFSVAPGAQGIVPMQSPMNDVFNVGGSNGAEVFGSTPRRDELPPLAVGAPVPT